VVVGYATGPLGYEAFLARVSDIGSGIINSAAFNQSVIEAGGRAVQAGAGLPALALFGAHHRSLLDSGLARTANGACAWATGDIARQNNTDTRAGLAEVGVCKDIESARIGLGIGHAYAKQDWSFGGEAKYNGEYLIAEAANANVVGIPAVAVKVYWKAAACFSIAIHAGAHPGVSRIRANTHVAQLGDIFPIHPYAYRF
jgi:hypothetical protein